MEHQGLKIYNVYLNDDSCLTVTYLTTKSLFVLFLPIDYMFSLFFTICNFSHFPFRF